MLFVLVLDPFLRQIDAALSVRHEAARACADDLGAVASDVGRLAILASLFADFGSVSGLALKWNMCVVVALTNGGGAWTLRRVRRELRRAVPEWSAFAVADAGKYLGVQLGPKAGALQRTSACAKWRERAAAAGMGTLQENSAARQ